jgi:branched-chain amino acid transport system substrate-binding protein
VVLFVSYTADSILYAKTMKSLDYKPSLLIGDDAGFSDPAFIEAAGNLVQGVFNRSSWAVGAPGSTTYLVNEMFRKKMGYDLDDTSARIMQGFMVLIDAIDRAGSTDPAKIQAALKATDLKPNQLIMGFNGVKFNDKGQNILAAAMMIQLQNGRDYVPVWPKALARAEPSMPYKGW